MDNSFWRGAKNMQPQVPGGAARPGNTGYGSGNIPFAPGMQSQQSVPVPNARDVYQGPPAGASSPAPSGFGAPDQGQQPQQAAPIDPAQTIAISQQLMQLLQAAADRAKQRGY